MATRYVQVKDHWVHCFYAGATTPPDVTPDFSRGQAVLFLHAAGSNGHSWHHQVDFLGAKHSPIAFDMPGHGRSDGVRGFASLDDYTDFVAALAETLGLGPLVIAGRSMGGAIAMNFALRYPKRVRGLVAIATAPRFDHIPDAMLAGMEAVAKGRATDQYTNFGFAEKTVKEHFEVVREGWREQAKTDPIVRYGDIKVCRAADIRARLGAIAVPTLVIAGAEDPVTPPQDARYIAEQIPGARLVVIEEASHNVTTEHPEQVNRELGQFLAAL